VEVQIHGLDQIRLACTVAPKTTVILLASIPPLRDSKPIER
jgi:hypothetical protein